MAAECPTVVARLAAGPVEYRLDRRGPATVMMMHGGHMRAGVALGEEAFAGAGYTVLAPSRPGYGRTPLSTGTSVAGFADVTRALCDHLGIARLAAVVGTSGGGPTAVTVAARHPDLVERLVLQCAVSWLPWPDRWTRLGARALLGPAAERATWASWRLLVRATPTVALRVMLGSLSTLPPARVVAGLRPEDRAALLALFIQMRSGAGFRNDLEPTPDTTAGVRQPTLVVATRHDGGVPFAHAESLTAAIAAAELVESHALSHVIWLDPDAPRVAAAIRAFLSRDPPRPAKARS
jgi:pimeloyl-ACP methyl ester carboxylesterase